ncbi:heavy-metal-associated domain-containing protein [Leuconostoc lactis]|uniref:heavy-metal-associated domain-containing protein n=1 Tax=Leuconostoc lactis TaxID=1246 RepID=UPI003745F9F0
MQKVTLKLGELSCPSCMSKIQKAMLQQLGVHHVDVLFNASKVKVEFDATQNTPEQLAQVIADLGYQVEKIIVK